MQGRLEASATIPAGGAEFTFSRSGLVGTSVRTVAAGTYRPDELVQAYVDELTAGEVALGGAIGFEFTKDWGESGSGRIIDVRMTDSATHYAVTFGSTLLRDFLGYTADLSGDYNYPATNVCQGVWLAGCPYDAPRGRDSGATRRDRSVQVSPQGHVSALAYSSRQKLGRVTWTVVGARRAIESLEVVAGESFEAWWLNTHGGRLTWYGASPQVRLYWDADDPSEYVDVRLTEPLDTFNPSRVDPTWIGLWPVTIDGYVVP